ncbi:hypothetical protein F2P81_023204 [Scophthalmus maximus]|uniref:Uncharacterized protein n=1 Tax=Scophthalmus maximus TaxID=52904 RepID=A0A6A4RZ14_SCOMX|nr:hypothetical protein F2P81_023204 [Scophthalmus maximus]
MYLKRSGASSAVYSEIRRGRLSANAVSETRAVDQLRDTARQPEDKNHNSRGRCGEFSLERKHKTKPTVDVHLRKDVLKVLTVVKPYGQDERVMEK